MGKLNWPDGTGATQSALRPVQPIQRSGNGYEEILKSIVKEGGEGDA